MPSTAALGANGIDLASLPFLSRQVPGLSGSGVAFLSKLITPLGLIVAQTRMDSSSMRARSRAPGEGRAVGGSVASGRLSTRS